MTYRDICLTLYNGEDHDIEIISSDDGTRIDFYFSEYINDGLYLDNIGRGNYYLFLKLTYDNVDNKDSYIESVI